MARNSVIHRPTSALVCLLIAMIAGCQQEMARQPRYDPYEPSGFFADGRSARRLPPGTIARGQLRSNTTLHTGKHDRQTIVATHLSMLGSNPWHVLATLPSTSRILTFAPDIPMPITRPLLERGRSRYNIYCAVCHGAAGYGDGIVVQRGFTQPPSFHRDPRQPERDRSRGLGLSLRQVPSGYYFEVITHGYGAMPDYRADIRPEDRWAIVAYIRALQLSQDFSVNDLPPEERRKLTE